MHIITMTPRLSIVVASRNDNHGGDMTRRMRLFVNGLIHQCNKHKYPVELIMVEWNPPADKPLLHEALPRPKAGDYLSLRYIIVPAEIHAQLRREGKIIGHSDVLIAGTAIVNNMMLITNNTEH